MRSYTVAQRPVDLPGNEPLHPTQAGGPSQSVWLEAPGWQRFDGLQHGFSCRLDDRAAGVLRFIRAGLRPYLTRQVHGTTVLTVHSGMPPTDQIEADGLQTAAGGILLGIVTADCVPILVVDTTRRVVAALHAGWRGTLAGISAHAIEQLKASGRETLSSVWVALGPAIGPCCYEVGRTLGESICEAWNIHAPDAWRPRGDKGYLDLRAVNREQLVRAGVPAHQVQTVGPCTCCDKRYASYRREGATAARQLSVIGWPGRTKPPGGRTPSSAGER